MAPRKYPRIKRSDFVDGNAYGSALWYGGLDYENVFGPHSFGTGEDAERHRAIWGHDPSETLEHEAASAPTAPHTFRNKVPRVRKKKSP